MSARKIVLWVILTLGTLALIVLISFTIFRDYHPTPKQTAERVTHYENAMKSGLPTNFIFVEERGNGYRLYKDEFGYYLVWHDTTYAASTHITFLGKVR